VYNNYTINALKAWPDQFKNNLHQRPEI